MKIYECNICHGTFADPTTIHYEQLRMEGPPVQHYQMRCPHCRTLLVHTLSETTFGIRMKEFEVVTR